MPSPLAFQITATRPFRLPISKTRCSACHWMARFEHRALYFIPQRSQLTIKIPIYIVRGRTDQLHSPSICLVIWLSALEAGQERVMYVDGATGQLPTRGLRQNLHVAREHEQIGPRLPKGVKSWLSCTCLRSGAIGRVVIRQLIPLHQPNCVSWLDTTPTIVVGERHHR
jgi:hypothetical protein